MHRPKISVVIAAKNENSNIHHCLKSLKEQTLPASQTETIIVDFASPDFIRYVNKKRHTIKNYRGAQLNYGVSRCHGNIIFFPDADMTFDKNLLKEVISLIETEKRDALYIPEVIIGRGLLGKIRNFERGFYNMTVIDGIRIVRRELYLSVGGFDEKTIRFGPDDWDFTKKIKSAAKNIDITANKLYHHEEGLNIKSYLSKKSKYTGTFKEYVRKWGKDDPDIKKQLGVIYRFVGVFTENGKWRRLLSHPFLTLKMFLLRLLVGLTYLWSRK